VSKVVVAEEQGAVAEEINRNVVSISKIALTIKMTKG